MSEREKIINWLNSIESNFDVSSLKIFDLHIWPILRWYLFKDVVLKEVYKKRKPENTIIEKVKIRLANSYVLLSGGFFYFKLKMKMVKKVEVIFAGSHDYHVFYNNKFINRFFYPITIWLKKNDIEFLYADYATGNKQEYSSEPSAFNIISVYKFYNKFYNHKRINSKCINHPDLFYDIIKKYNEEFKASYNENSFYQIVQRILIWAKVYELLITKSDASIALLLCYYNEPMYGLNLACFRTQIKSIDVQHGPQGKLHAAYSGFKRLPDNGYSCLPNYFWVWDGMSYDSLKNRLRNTEKHQVLLGGNPWINFLKKKEKKTKVFLNKNKNKKIILYTLQPIMPFIPDIIINALRETPNDYCWWFRIHPRMTKLDSEEVKTIVQTHGAMNIVNFDDATNMALPFVLENSHIHISKSSGCVLEANILGISSIIIDPIGKNYFKNIIDNKTNFYFDKGDLWQVITRIDREKRENKLVDFSPILKNLLK